MGFAYPWWLAGVVVVAGVAVGYVAAQRRTARHTLRFANFEVLDRVAPRRPGRRRGATRPWWSWSGWRC